MTLLVPIALVGWIFCAIGLFTMLPPRRAVLTAYILAWLFLPQAGVGVPGLPDLDKMTSSGLGVMLGILLFDAGRLATLRFSWADLPVIAWCVSPLISSLTNGLGTYDGLSGVLREFFTWAMPYFVARMYFTDLESLRELAIAVFIGGLIYVPLCLIEIRLSPQLHRWVYGFHPSHFAMTIRFGGYRPMVFMQHGLAVGMWMTSATLTGLWLWHTGALARLREWPVWVLLSALAVTTVMCKSLGALALLAMGAALLIAAKHLRTNLILIAVILMPPTYMIVRVEGWWHGEQLVSLAEKIDEERAFSLAGRFKDEDLLIERADERPIFGWGGWNRWRVLNEWGDKLTSSDGMWVIARGERGNFGLAANTLLVLLPVVLFLRRVHARYWGLPQFAAPAVLAMLLMLWALDNLLNAMHNPVYMMAAGGLTGFALAYPQMLARQRMMQQYQMAAMLAAQQHALAHAHQQYAEAQRRGTAPNA